ncbi:MAG: regulatory iron-sulfur-containing complex subunit RicT [Candidatus Binatus sp.]|uniref:PSP1 domain-containing protein n=1 Tax=Candidatus Binatus sp. TaxID=2811406 RepID=UPI002719C87C|nr:regulatory iron-sulfur-containing complex subunit RicT [Candidatus Binatus sp.]MDO8433988.1 regulatory iron-sulfur-containing complex subunit RicT [Candidatus Binatus sp.]
MAQIDPFEGGQTLPKIVAVSLQQTGHLCNFLAGEERLQRGDRVLVDTEAGVRIGTIEIEPHEPAQTLDLSSMRPIIRAATDSDYGAEQENIAREARARRLCVERIRERRLQMKLVNADYTFDGRKAVFYFVAEGRVDFRDLVRDLANALRVRVEMKQIGARDETKVTGGLGPCGRELCCSSWLRDFEAVTVKMARDQGLALNPSRLAGMCGRLKCCLRYEYATYVELKRALPNLGKRVQCVKGDGKVIRQNILKQTVLIQREEDGGVIEATLEDLVTSRPQ